jgi:hypothetical protein
MKCEYINFELIEEKAKTNVYVCRNNKSGAKLGVVKWYSPWRQYCYFPFMTIYSASCLQDVKSFLDKINQERSPK